MRTRQKISLFGVHWFHKFAGLCLCSALVDCGGPPALRSGVSVAPPTRNAATVTPVIASAASTAPPSTPTTDAWRDLCERERVWSRPDLTPACPATFSGAYLALRAGSERECGPRQCWLCSTNACAARGSSSHAGSEPRVLLSDRPAPSSAPAYGRPEELRASRARVRAGRPAQHRSQSDFCPSVTLRGRAQSRDLLRALSGARLGGNSDLCGHPGRTAPRRDRQHRARARRGRRLHRSGRRGAPFPAKPWRRRGSHAVLTTTHRAYKALRQGYATSRRSNSNHIALYRPRCAPAQRLNRGIENASIPRFSSVLLYRGIQRVEPLMRTTNRQAESAALRRVPPAPWPCRLGF